MERWEMKWIANWAVENDLKISWNIFAILICEWSNFRLIDATNSWKYHQIPTLCLLILDISISIRFILNNAIVSIDMLWAITENDQTNYFDLVLLNGATKSVVETSTHPSVIYMSICISCGSIRKNMFGSIFGEVGGYEFRVLREWNMIWFVQVQNCLELLHWVFIVDGPRVPCSMYPVMIEHYQITISKQFFYFFFYFVVYFLVHFSAELLLQYWNFICALFSTMSCWCCFFASMKFLLIILFQPIKL